MSERERDRERERESIQRNIINSLQTHMHTLIIVEILYNCHDNLHTQQKLFIFLQLSDCTGDVTVYMMTVHHGSTALTSYCAACIDL